MTIFKRVLFICILLLATVSVLVAGPASDYGLLQIKDGKLSAAEDNGGMPVQLKGMSLYWSNWGAAWWNESAVDQSVDWLGCEIIRAAMSVGSKEGEEPTDVDGGYLNKPETNIAWVKTVVEEAIFKDIYVIIDWHDHAAETHLDQSLAFFTQMAREYGNVPNVIFEIYNEPLTTDWDGIIKPYSETVINAIRSTISDYDGQPVNNVIIAGTPFYSQLGSSVVNNPIDSSYNIAYTLHFYAASHSYDGSLGDKMRATVDAGLCVIVTEWGTVPASGSGSPDEEGSQEWITGMDDYGISWCNWSLHNKDEGASMFTTEASTVGPWQDSDLTESGTMVKGWLPDPTTQLSICPSLIKFFHTGGTQTTTVTKGSYVSAVSDQTWLTVSPASGSTGQIVSITAGSYDSKTENRTGNIIFTDSDGNISKVKVDQLLNNGNLALGKNAVASSTEGGYPAIDAIDGDEESSRWSSEWSDPQWIYVDLGEDTNFNAISLHWEASYSTHGFLQVAPDGSDPNNNASYENIIEFTWEDGRGSFSVGHAFQERIGRYVRMLSLERTTIGGNQYGASLYEFEIYADRNILAIPLPKNQIVYADGADLKYGIIANVIWTAYNSADWLTIDPATGGSDFNYGHDYATVHVPPNYDGMERTATLTFIGGDAAPKTLEITQPMYTEVYNGEDENGDPVHVQLLAYLTGSNDNGDGTTDFNFNYISRSNGIAHPITIEPQADWMTIKSVGADGFVINAEANTSEETRDGLIIVRTVTYPCLVPLRIYQDPYEPPVITANPPSWDCDYQSSTDSLYSMITSDVEWTVTTKPFWVTVNPAGGNPGTSTVFYSIEANDSVSGRTGYITFATIDGESSVTVTINQSGAPAQSEWTPAGGGEGQNFDLTFDGSYTAASNASWLHITPTSGEGGPVSFYMSADTNNTGVTRSGTITIQGGGVYKEIQVTQDPVSLVINPQSIYVPGGGGTASFNITSNVIWWSAYTTDGGGWLNINPDSYSGVGDGTVSFTLSQNNTGQPRTATITVIGGDVPTQTVTITQGR